MAQMNRHHIDEEEKTHLPLSEKMASEKKLDALFERYERARKERRAPKPGVRQESTTL